MSINDCKHEETHEVFYSNDHYAAVIGKYFHVTGQEGIQCAECEEIMLNKEQVFRNNAKIKEARNKVIEQELELIGKWKRDAIGIIESKGCEWRITKEDGKGYMVTMDWRANRFDLTLENDTVKDYSIG